MAGGDAAADLSDLFIVLIEWFAIFPVEESGDAHNFFLLVDNGQRQDILDDKACLVHGLFLQGEKRKGRCALSFKLLLH